MEIPYRVLDPDTRLPPLHRQLFKVVAGYDDRSAIHKLAERSDAVYMSLRNVDADAHDEVADNGDPRDEDLLRVTQEPYCHLLSTRDPDSPMESSGISPGPCRCP